MNLNPDCGLWTAQIRRARPPAILTAPEPQTQLMSMVLTMNAIAAEAEMLLCGRPAILR